MILLKDSEEVRQVFWKFFNVELFKRSVNGHNSVTTFDFFCQVKIEVFQLVKHEVLSDGEGFQEETEDLEEEEEEEDAGILNSEQEWL